MFRDGKFAYELGAVAVDDSSVYLGFQGTHSSIAAFKQEDMSFIGIYPSMCGSPCNMMIIQDKEKLLCSTTAGYIYVWDTSDETLMKLAKITTDPLTLNGFVHPDTRVTPLVEVPSEAIDDRVQVDHVPNTSTMVALSSKGTVTLIDMMSGKKRGTLELQGLDGRRANCLKVDSQVGTFGEARGHWVAVGGYKGYIGLLFLELQLVDGGGVGGEEDDTEVDTSKTYALTHNTGDHSDINSLDFRFRSATSTNVTLLAGCTDGAVRCVVFKQVEGALETHKEASYLHCRAARHGSVRRITSDRSLEGAPYMISLCAMQMPFDMHNTADDEGKHATQEASTFCCELLLQKLLHDQSDRYTIVAHMREFITDVKIATDQTFIVFTTVDDVYIVRRDGSGKEWTKPSRVEWTTSDNLKLMAKVL